MQVTKAEVLAVPAVPFTKTWHPYHHGDIITQAGIAIKEAGLEVVYEKYELSLNGMDLFTTWRIANDARDHSWEIGFRNSMQKRFALGAVAGITVMVCGNLCLSGEWMELIKHTGGMDEDRIGNMFDRAVVELIKSLHLYEKWVNSLKEHLVTKDQVKQLAFDSMKVGVFAPSRFSNFLKAYEEETAENRAVTLYNYQGACTRLMRGDNLFQVQRRNAALETLLRKYVNMEADEVIARINGGL